MDLDKSKLTRGDVALLRDCGFDVSSTNILFSARAVTRELVRLRAARRIDRQERLLLTALGAIGGAVVASFIFTVVLA